MKNSDFSEKKNMLIAILSLAWPAMLEELLGTAVQYIDTAMVGSLGTAATAAVGGTATVNWLIGGTLHALGIGFLALIAKAYGAGEKRKAGDYTAQATLITLAAGTLFTVLALALSRRIPVWMKLDEGIRDIASSYLVIIYSSILLRTFGIIYGTVLRAAGDTKTPMYVGIVMNLVNVALNFLMIYDTRTVSVFGRSLKVFGMGLGVQGAALASTISYTVGGIIIIAAVFRHPEISPRGHSFRPDRAILATCLRISFPNMLQRFATSLGYVVFATMINSLGEVSAASHTICNTVEELFLIPCYGMQAASATLSGNAFGARDGRRAKLLVREAYKGEILLMVLSSSMLYAFSPQLVGVFSKDPAVIALAVRILRMVAFSEPFFGIATVTEGLMQGAGETFIPFVCGISTMWIVRIGGTFVCTRLLGKGLLSAWGCMIAHNVSFFLLLSLLISGVMAKAEKSSPQKHKM